MSRIFHWMRGDEGWSTFLLLCVLVLVPVVAFQDAQWLNQGTDALPKAALLGAWSALLLARSRLPTRLALPGGLLLGSGAVFVTVGNALPPLRALVDRLGPFWAWLQLVREDKPHGPDPLSPLFWETVRQTGFLAERFAVWVNTALGGGTSSDNLVFLLIIAVLTWTAAFLTGWSLYRWHAPLPGILPTGVFVLVNVFLANQGWGYVVTYLVCAFLLMITLTLYRMQRSWQHRGLDFADELPFDVGFVSSWLAMGIVVLSLPLPGLNSNPVARAWWNALSEPWSEVETTFNRLFSGINNPNQTLSAGTRGSLVLGGSFDPRQDTPVFMYVTTDESLPDYRELRELGEEPRAPVHYWRGLTYDTYTGRGWQNSERVVLDRRPDQEVLQVSPVGFITLTQDVEIVPPRVDLIYAANQPVTVSVPYRVQAMGAEDYAALTFRDLPLTGIRYAVTSWVPNLGEEDLRSASTTYPAWVTRRYLQLPSSLPQRVTDLSKQLTADARTPYDKALAIQEYLRKLPYDPRILLPAGDFDAVDYFLFLQKGYCDYFGTAMAVMLRATGVPARVARGYLPGEFDWENHRYTVRENRQHVWTEVYFPPYGWVEFEPTPGQPPITRPPGSLLGSEPAPPAPEAPTPQPPPSTLGELGLWGTGIIVLVMAALIGLLLWTLYPAWEARLSASQYAQLIYLRMARYARWAGLSQRPSQTPREYTSSIVTGLASRTGSLRVLRWRLSPPALSGDEEESARVIALTYQEAVYGPAPLGEESRRRVREAWSGLKRHLWPAILARRVPRRRGK